MLLVQCVTQAPNLTLPNLNLMKKRCNGGPARGARPSVCRAGRRVLGHLLYIIDGGHSVCGDAHAKHMVKLQSFVILGVAATATSEASADRIASLEKQLAEARAEMARSPIVYVMNDEVCVCVCVRTVCDARCSPTHLAHLPCSSSHLYHLPTRSWARPTPPTRRTSTRRR